MFIMVIIHFYCYYHCYSNYYYCYCCCCMSPPVGRMCGYLPSGEASVRTQVNTEKKQKTMAARAASAPSFRGLSSSLDACHWLARKQNPTNQTRDQSAVGTKGQPPVQSDRWRWQKQRRWSLTWHPNVGHDGLLPVLHAADLRKVNVQRQEAGAAEEAQRSHGDGIAAGVLVAVEDAELLDIFGPVNVTLVSNAAKDDDGEELQTFSRQPLA